MAIYTVTDQLKPTEPLIPLNLEKVLFLIVHHVAAKNYTWEAANTYHKGKGWNCCGYNEMIYKNGDVYICRGDTIGAQCKNMNSKSYGIALEGNYDAEKTMPEAQLKALVTRIIYNKKRFPNFINLKRHSYFLPTSCPGKYFPWGEMAAAVTDKDLELIKAIGDIEPILAKLQAAGLIQSPEYWRLNAVNSGICKGEYVRTLMSRMADKLR